MLPSFLDARNRKHSVDKMAEASQRLFTASLKGMLESGAYSDLTITCGEDTYKVHRVIVCSRAEFFARALRFGGQESNTGIINLPEDDPDSIKRLIQYMYEGEYTLQPPDTINQHLLLHSKMYELADKFVVTGLKNLVCEKFRRACKILWNKPDFCRAARHVFSTTPDTDHGLRDIIVRTICAHNELIAKQENRKLVTSWYYYFVDEFT